MGAEMERGMAHDGKTQREVSERPVSGARERTEPAIAMPSLGTSPPSAAAPQEQREQAVVAVARAAEEACRFIGRRLASS